MAQCLATRPLPPTTTHTATAKATFSMGPPFSCPKPRLPKTPPPLHSFQCLGLDSMRCNLPRLKFVINQLYILFVSTMARDQMKSSLSRIRPFCIYHVFDHFSLFTLSLRDEEQTFTPDEYCQTTDTNRRCLFWFKRFAFIFLPLPVMFHSHHPVRVHAKMEDPLCRRCLRSYCM